MSLILGMIYMTESMGRCRKQGDTVNQVGLYCSIIEPMVKTTRHGPPNSGRELKPCKQQSSTRGNCERSTAVTAVVEIGTVEKVKLEWIYLNAHSPFSLKFWG